MWVFFSIGLGVFIYFSYGFIQYYFAPGEILSEKTSQRLMIFQVILSFATTVSLFVSLSNMYYIDEKFGEENWKRIVFVICLLFICFFITGLLIELFLVLTDKNYRHWRKGEDMADLNNNQNN